MAFGDDPVLLDVTFDVYRRAPGGRGAERCRQDRARRILAGELEATSGERWVGPSVRIGYLEQGFQGQDPALTPVETVRKTRAMYEGEAVALLAKFLFRYDQMRTPVRSLSGGERTRLELCLLMLSGANCLVLDEPTNHLDIESMEVLEGGRVVRRDRDPDLARPLPARPALRQDPGGPGRGRAELRRRLRRLDRRESHRVSMHDSSRGCDEVVACRACPRLVEWRERVAREKVARFADQEYWGGRSRAGAMPGRGPDPRAGSCWPRRESHREDLHRRPER